MIHIHSLVLTVARPLWSTSPLLFPRHLDPSGERPEIGNHIPDPLIAYHPLRRRHEPGLADCLSTFFDDLEQIPIRKLPHVFRIGQIGNRDGRRGNLLAPAPTFPTPAVALGTVLHVERLPPGGVPLLGGQGRRPKCDDPPRYCGTDTDARRGAHRSRSPSAHLCDLSGNRALFLCTALTDGHVVLRLPQDRQTPAFPTLPRGSLHPVSPESPQ